MDLKEYSVINAGHSTSKHRDQKPFISVNRYGHMIFNSAACQLIGLAAGDQVKFFQDKRAEENWYVEKVMEDGFVLGRKKNTKAPRLNACCRQIVTAIFDSQAFIGTKGQLLVKPEPISVAGRSLWQLDTSKLIN